MQSHYLLIYDLAPDYLQRREALRPAHLDLARAAEACGELVLAGALDAPTEQAFLLFVGQGPEAATAFAENDPYVRLGLVTKWQVRRWNTVVGRDAANPIRQRGVR